MMCVVLIGCLMHFINVVNASEDIYNSSIHVYPVALVESTETEVKQVVETISEQENRNWYDVYTIDCVNLRSEPSLTCEVLKVLGYGVKLKVCEYNDDWLFVDYDTEAYISKDYVSASEPAHKTFDISFCTTGGFKSYMPYTAITDINSKQYELQNQAYTGRNGIRTINDRYCVAVGTYFGASIGDYINLILENGTVIPCIVSDIKSDADTEYNNIATSVNGCVCEFVVDTSVMNKDARYNGDISSCQYEWESKVTKVKVYEYNFFGG